MRVTPRRLAGFTSKPITASSQFLVTKKPVDFDYVALDASGLVGGAFRLSKNLNSEQRRHREVGRHVVQGIQQILKRINCRTSLLIALDGAEPLAKASATRSAPLTRRLESRLARLPGTALMQTVEERLVHMMPDRQFLPKEVIISGTGVAGCVEEKMTAWSLDLACRGDLQAGNVPSLALVGAQELYLNALALTPYYNVTSLVQGQGADVRQLTLANMLEWLGLEELAARGSSRTMARVRTDVVFLLLLCQGSSMADLPALLHARFPVLFATYRERVLQFDMKPDEATPEGASPFLFSDLPGNKMELSLDALAALLTKSNAVPSPSTATHADVRVDGYLELALQTHASLCLGYTPDHLFVPPNLSTSSISSGGTASGEAQGGVTISQLYAHVRYLLSRSSGDGGTARRCARDIKGTAPRSGSSGGPASETYYPFFSPTQPLTAAEFTILCQSTVPGAEAALQLCINGHGSSGGFGGMGRGQASQHLQVLPGLLKKITTADTSSALQLVREALSFAVADRPHRCVCLSPSYYWWQHSRTKMWHMRYVDLGVRGAEVEVRRLRNALTGVSMILQSGSSEGPVLFDREVSRWAPVLRFPFCEQEGIDDAGGAGTTGEAVVAPVKCATVEAETHESPLSVAATTGPITATTRASERAAAADRRGMLKILTWNVMFDRYSGQPTPLGMPGIDWCSPKRYPVLAKLIAEEDADVVGMQEVEPVFLAFLAEQPWCRERYILSCATDSGVLQPWGVAMLVHRRRLPVAALTHVNIPAWSGHTSLMPIVTLTMPHGPVHVASVHLLAPFTKNNESVRTAQDQALRHRLTKGIPGGEDCIAMGDFNDWPENAFVMPAETQYRECWPLVHPHSRGHTLDESNTFCKLKIEEMFFGRSDKVFLRSRQLRPVRASLVGTRSVNEVNGNTDAPAYLFPSDHYGVSMTFSL